MQNQQNLTIVQYSLPKIIYPFHLLGEGVFFLHANHLYMPLFMGAWAGTVAGITDHSTADISKYTAAGVVAGISLDYSIETLYKGAFFLHANHLYMPLFMGAWAGTVAGITDHSTADISKYAAAGVVVGISLEHSMEYLYKGLFFLYQSNLFMPLYGGVLAGICNSFNLRDDTNIVKITTVGVITGAISENFVFPTKNFDFIPAIFMTAAVLVGSKFILDNYLDGYVNGDNHASLYAGCVAALTYGLYEVSKLKVGDIKNATDALIEDIQDSSTFFATYLITKSGFDLLMPQNIDKTQVVSDYINNLCPSINKCLPIDLVRGPIADFIGQEEILNKVYFVQEVVGIGVSILFGLAAQYIINDDYL